MPTRNVVLTEHQADLVARLVASGRYQNASEVLREGLRLIEGRELERGTRLRALREAARHGVADIEADRYADFDSPSKLDQHLNAIAGEAIAGKRPATRAK
jgi:antitoxin ParD1/3/4